MLSRVGRRWTYLLHEDESRAKDQRFVFNVHGVFGGLCGKSAQALHMMHIELGH